MLSVGKHTHEGVPRWRHHKGAPTRYGLFVDRHAALVSICRSRRETLRSACILRRPSVGCKQASLTLPTPNRDRDGRGSSIRDRVGEMSCRSPVMRRANPVSHDGLSTTNYRESRSVRWRRALAENVGQDLSDWNDEPGRHGSAIDLVSIADMKSAAAIKCRRIAIMPVAIRTP
jgi:hypothetical protein